VRALSISALCFVAGCATTERPVDASASDTAPNGDAGSLPLLVIGDVGEPDWSCLRMGRPPDPGPAVDVFVTFRAFRSDAPLSGLCVRAYAGPILASDACADSDVRTDPGGLARLSVPSTGTFVVRMFAHEGLVAADTFPDTLASALTAAQLITMDGSPGTVVDLSRSVLNEMSLHAGLASRDPTAAVVAAQAVDCVERPVGGAQLRLAREDGSEVALGPGGARRIYAADNGVRFDADVLYTGQPGIVAFVDVPVSAPGEHLWIETYGRISGDAPTLVGCTSVQIVAGATTIATVRPPGAGDGCPELP
jgi:hypothetical protein